MSLQKKIETEVEKRMIAQRERMLKMYIEDFSTVYIALGNVLFKRGYKDKGINNFILEMNEFLPEHLQQKNKEENKW